MKNESAIFMPTLLAVAPELQPLCDQHVEYYHEVINHLLMADITRFIESLNQVRVLTAGRLSDEARGLLVRLLGFFEKCLDLPDTYVEEFLKSPDTCAKECERSPDAYLRDLVLTSFLENLDQQNEFFESLKALMGPKLRKHLEDHPH